MSEILHSALRTTSAPMMFAALEPHMQEQLRQASAILSFASEQIIHLRGEAASGFWLIETGSVAIGQFLRNGEFRGTTLLGPGDSWGELAMITGRPRVVDAIARAESRLRHISAARFDAILAQHPAAMRGLLMSLSQQLQELIELVSGIRRGSALPRIAGILLNLCAGRPLPARIAITQQELAELLGLTRATVNAGLRDFEEQGAVRRSYGEIHIIDRETLSLAVLEL